MRRFALEAAGPNQSKCDASFDGGRAGLFIENSHNWKRVDAPPSATVWLCVKQERGIGLSSTECGGVAEACRVLADWDAVVSM
jgi:hypothetical protein